MKWKKAFFKKSISIFLIMLIVFTTKLSTVNVSLAGDTSAPQILSVTYNGVHLSASYEEDSTDNLPIDSNIVITFDEGIRNLDNSEITNDNISDIVTVTEIAPAIDTKGDAVSYTATINGDKTVISIYPNNDLWYNQGYMIEIASVEDINDNAFNPIFTTNASTKFKTLENSADTTGPTTTSLLPADETINIPVNTNLTIEFDEPVFQGPAYDLGSITIDGGGESIVIKADDTEQISGWGTNTIIVNPTKNLKGNTVYSMYIDNGLYGIFYRDLSNNYGTDSAGSWNFTTEDVDSITWVVTDFEESLANDGSIKDTSKVQAILSSDTFKESLDNGTDYVISNIPEGLTADLNRVSDSMVEIKLIGNASNHESTDDISNLTIEFKGSALATNPTNGVGNNIKDDIAVNFTNHATISCNDETYSELSSNNGSMVFEDQWGEPIYTEIQISNGTFKEEITKSYVTINNLPEGIDYNVTRYNAEYLQISFSGSATNHLNSNDIDCSFTVAASAITGANFDLTTTDMIHFDFDDPGELFLTWSGTNFREANNNDGSINTDDKGTITLYNDTFTVTDGALIKDTDYSITNLPDGLNASLVTNGNSKVTLTFTGNAIAHLSENDLSNITIEFLDHAFTTNSASAFSNYSNSNIAIDFYDQMTLSITSSLVLNETDDNDGAVTPTDIVIVSNNGNFFMIYKSNVTANNLPVGMDFTVVNDSINQITITITGKAANHENAHDISDVSFTIAATRLDKSGEDLTTPSITMDFNDSEGATITGVEVKTAPTKTTYTQGENLDLTGLVITLTKSDATTEDVVLADFAANLVTTNPINGTALTTADTGVTITANGQTAIQPITVNAIINAQTPTILVDLSNKNGLVGGDSITLDATSVVTDGGTISYQWYSADDASGGNPQFTSISTPSVTFSSSCAETFYYYCTVTNTNNSVNGNTTASIDTAVSTVTFTLPVLTAMVSIDDTTPQFGDILTASVTGDNSVSDNFTYQWYRNDTVILGASGSSYTVAQDDITHTIKVVVESNDTTGTVTSANTAVVEKADAILVPAQVTTSDISHDKITVVAQNGMEFACVVDGATLDDSTQWQEALEFTGLQPSTDYDLYARAKETDTHKASTASTVADVVTIAAPVDALTGTVTISGTAMFDEDLIATVSNHNATGILLYQWKRDGVEISGGTSNIYTLVQEDIGTVISCKVTDSGPSAKTGYIESIATAKVDKASSATPSAPTLASKSYNSVTLTAIVGNEYSKDNGVSWQQSNVFTGLTANTAYSFIQRVAESATHFQSQPSSSFNVTTNAQPLSGGSSGDSSVPPATPTDDLEDALDDATPNSNGVVEETVELEENDEGQFALELPDNFLESDYTVEVTVVVEDVEVTLSNSMFDGDEESIEIVVEPLDVAEVDLPEEVKDMIGDLPLYNISLNINNEQASWNGDEDIEISIELNEVENLDDHKFVAVYIDENGDVHLLRTSLFTDGSMNFTTKHLSDYAVVYIEKTFNDLGNHSWAVEGIEALAARGIINGTSDTTYSPAKNITRADFITLIVRYFNLAGSTIDNFSDVESGMYYSDSIAIAKYLGIVTGSGDNQIHPTSAITRQDMMVILERALKVAEEIDRLETTSKTYKTFNDSECVADYAKESVDYMISTGIINGSNNNINPTGNTTRAEVATMLYNLLKKLINN